MCRVVIWDIVVSPPELVAVREVHTEAGAWRLAVELRYGEYPPPRYKVLAVVGYDEDELRRRMGED